MEAQKVTLTGTQETMLYTLYGKAMDSRNPTSVLRDRDADEAMRHIDYDFSKIKMSRRDQTSTAVRSKQFDQCVEDFLDRHPACTVLNVGCGLDARIYRLRPPETVCWYDIDLPDVMELRHRLYPDRDGHHTIGCSVTDPHVFDQVPVDKPVMVVAEGLTPYLRAADGIAMLRRIVERFPGGEIVFDGYTHVGVWLIRRIGPVKASGAQVDWSIDDPHELEKAVPGLIFDAQWQMLSKSDLGPHYSWLSRQMLRAVAATPLGWLGRGLRYHFGRD